jgi:hypothetical protein|tara:strand:- start:1117 stop:1515 length:399 start_codon:yes stop_codon:yes gene_type:complete
MLEGLIETSPTTTFAVTLAIAFFIAKFLIGRWPLFDDFVVALADTPAVLSAAVFSSMVVLSRSEHNQHDYSLALVLVGLIFVLNVYLYRVVENYKMSLSTNWLPAVGVILVSFFLAIVGSFNIAFAAFEGKL